MKARNMKSIFFVGLIALGACFFLRSAAAVTLLNEGFEGSVPSDNGWSVGDANTTGTAAYWDDVDSAFGGEGTHSGSWKGYCADIGNAGTSTGPLYQNNMSAYMSKAINLSGYSAATLTFWYKIPSIEGGNYDKLRVYIGSTIIWERTTAQTAWTQVSLNLNSYVGATRTLKFEFYSDGSGTAEGAYLDDIVVDATPLPNVDLAMRNVVVTRPADTSAKTFTGCSFDIYNYGPALNNGTLLVTYYLSSDTTFGNSDDKDIGDTGFGGVSIAAGGTYPISLSSLGLENMTRRWVDGTVTVPAGNYYLFAKVTCSTATETDSNDNYNRTSSTFYYSPPLPEADVRGNGVSIADGDTSPSTGDWTDFGSTVVGTPFEHTFYVHNTGNAPLTVGTPTVPNGYTLTVDLISPIPAGGSDWFRVRLNASAVGTYAGDISFSDNDSNENPYNFRITGTVTQPNVDLAMRNVVVTRPADTSAKTFTGCSFDIYNYGPALNNGTLLVTYYLSSDTTFGNSDDKDIGDTGFGGVSIAAGGTYPISLSSLGLENMTRRWVDGTVSVPAGNCYLFAKVTCSTATETDPNDNYNRTSSTFYYSPPLPEADVHGNGVSIADGDTSPSTGDWTDFGSTPVGTSVTRRFYVYNTGTAALTPGTITVPSGFTLAIGLVSSISAGASDYFDVRLNATAAGTYSGDISIPNNDPNENPYNFRITGTVVPITVDLAMRNVVATRPSDITAKTFTDCSFDIYNYGPALNNGTLMVTYYLSSDATFGNSDDRDIGDTGFSGVSIAAGGTYPVTLSSLGLQNMTKRWVDGTASVSAGNYYVFAKVTCSTATETDPSDNYNRTSSTFYYSPVLPPEMDVRGNGIPIADGDTTPSTGDWTDFGTTPMGTPVERTFYVYNTGTGPLIPGTITVPGGYTLTVGLISSIPAGSSDWFRVRLNASAVGTYAGDISIPNNDSNENPYNFRITGTVIASGWDAGYVDIGGGWRRLTWFGDYVPMGSAGWIWHSKHGFYFMPASNTPQSMWMYAQDMGWLWTGNATYPFLYRLNDGAWLWFNGSRNPRWFINMITSQWERWP